MVDEVMQRLWALGIELPEPPLPLGAYLAVVESGLMLHVSMQGPVVAGQPKRIGLVGGELTIENGRHAAKLAVINALSQIHRHLGSFDRIKQIVRLEGYVACVSPSECFAAERCATARSVTPQNQRLPALVCAACINLR